MLKLIASDLDHTLLDSEKNIAQETMEALRNAERNGVNLTVATGRCYTSANRYAQMLSPECKLICYNGALVKDGEETLFEKSLTVELMRRILDFVYRENLYVQFYEEHKILYDTRIEPIWRDPDIDYIGRIVVDSFDGYELKPSPKALIVLEPERLAGTMKKLKEEFGDVLHITNSRTFLIEVMMKGVDKAVALKKLAGHLGISSEEVLACGDSGNDLEMLSWAGIGVAMANAEQKIKDTADYVTCAEDSLGVLETLKRFRGEFFVKDSI